MKLITWRCEGEIWPKYGLVIYHQSGVWSGLYLVYSCNAFRNRRIIGVRWNRPYDRPPLWRWK